MATPPVGYSKHLKSVTDTQTTNISANAAAITAVQALVDKSDSNDDKVKSALLAVISYLNAFSLTYEVQDVNDDVVNPPDWSALTTSINSLEDHET